MVTLTTPLADAAWRPDIQYFLPEDSIPSALILTTSTVSGSVEGDAVSVRVAYVDDAAATFTAEGDEIPEAAPGLSEVLVHTGKITQLVRISREQYSQRNTASLLSNSVSRAITRAANVAYLSQPMPTAPEGQPVPVTPPGGILHQAGIIAGGAITGDLDVLADAIALIEANNGSADYILASPSAWGSLRKLKAGTALNSSLLGAGSADLTKSLFSVPVIVSNALPAGGLLVIDKSAIVSAVGRVEIAVSQDAYFSSDSIGLRATFRFGATLVRPDRVASLTVTAA